MVHLLRRLRTAPMKESPTMTEIDDSELKARVEKLSPRMQESFLRSVDRVYEKESRLMLRFIAESRAMLGVTRQEIEDEQEVLRATQDKLSAAGEEERRKYAEEYSRHPKRKNKEIRPGDYVGVSDVESMSTVSTTSEHSDTTISFMNESPQSPHLSPRTASPRPPSAVSPRLIRTVSPLPQNVSPPIETRQPRRHVAGNPPIPLRAHELSKSADGDAHRRGQEATVHVPGTWADVTIHRHGWVADNEPKTSTTCKLSPKPNVRNQSAAVTKTSKHLVRLDSEIFSLPGRPSSASNAVTKPARSPELTLDVRAYTSISLNQKDPAKYEKEKQELMRELAAADDRMANERHRQSTLLQLKKAEKKAKKEETEEKVNELLEQTVTHHRQKEVDKERQGQKVKEKLEMKKREKTELELQSRHHASEMKPCEVIELDLEDAESTTIQVAHKPAVKKKDHITEL